MRDETFDVDTFVAIKIAAETGDAPWLMADEREFRLTVRLEPIDGDTRRADEMPEQPAVTFRHRPMEFEQATS